MNVCEIFYSINGEGKFSGRPATFVRFSGCNLRCAYCDTKYAYEQGKEMTVDEIVNTIEVTGSSNYVTLTGGEPLLQDKNDLISLIKTLLNKNYIVNVETNGSIPLLRINDENLVYTVDIKCPCSGVSKSFSEINLVYLRPSTDEVKFVVANKKDLDFVEKCLEYLLCDVIISPVWGEANLQELVEFIKKHGDKKIRLQVQLHKIIWDPLKRGV